VAKLSVGLFSVRVNCDAEELEMIVDCDRCEVRGDACGDCVITVLLGSTPGDVRFDETERRAIDALAGAGLVPRLRLVADDPSGDQRGVGKRVQRGAERSSREAG
jgi:hypothetical protein